MTSLPNPTSQIDLDFGHYLAERERSFATKMDGGVPNYAFSLDSSMRRKIAMMRPVRDLAQAMASSWVPETKQQYLLRGVAVGPRQYPEIHMLGEDCARRLGIGVPQIFVYHDHEINGFTIATDDTEPIIVLTSALVEAMDTPELHFIIGHECGHIHNLHGVYNLVAMLLSRSLSAGLPSQMAKAGVKMGLIKSLGAYGLAIEVVSSALQSGLRLFFMHWSRCAEITCDRAGLICCGDLRAAQLALAKLVTGGAEKLQGFNIEDFVQQLGKVNTMSRLNELFATHPLTPRRIEALRLFAECEALYDWRPELRGAAAGRSKSEVDQDCERLINVFAKGAGPA